MEIQNRIERKIKELKEEIHDFMNAKDYKCYQDEVDRLWSKVIVLEEILEEDD